MLQGKAGLARLLDPARKADGGDTHFLRERERHQVDDNCSVSRIFARVFLGLGRPLAADANPDGSRIIAEPLKKKTGSIDRAASLSRVGHPGARPRPDGRQQQFVSRSDASIASKSPLHPRSPISVALDCSLMLINTIRV